MISYTVNLIKVCLTSTKLLLTKVSAYFILLKFATYFVYALKHPQFVLYIISNTLISLNLVVPHPIYVNASELNSRKSVSIDSAPGKPENSNEVLFFHLVLHLTFIKMYNLNAKLYLFYLLLIQMYNSVYSL